MKKQKHLKIEKREKQTKTPLLCHAKLISVCLSIFKKKPVKHWKIAAIFLSVNGRAFSKVDILFIVEEAIFYSFDR